MFLECLGEKERAFCVDSVVNIGCWRIRDFADVRLRSQMLKLDVEALATKLHMEQAN